MKRPGPGCTAARDSGIAAAPCRRTRPGSRPTNGCSVTSASCSWKAATAAWIAGSFIASDTMRCPASSPRYATMLWAALRTRSLRSSYGPNVGDRDRTGDLPRWASGRESVLEHPQAERLGHHRQFVEHAELRRHPGAIDRTRGRNDAIDHRRGETDVLLDPREVARRCLGTNGLRREGAAEPVRRCRRGCRTAGSRAALPLCATAGAVRRRSTRAADS